MTRRYLLDLDYVGDPCWECVSGMHGWLVNQLLEAKARYQSGKHLSCIVVYMYFNFAKRFSKLYCKKSNILCYFEH